MERTEVLDMMGALKLYGMKGAYDETLAIAIKRKHEPQRLVGDLLKAEISEKQARSIRYQMTIAKLPLAKDVDDFAFKGTPINEGLVLARFVGCSKHWRGDDRAAVRCLGLPGLRLHRHEKGHAGSGDAGAAGAGRGSVQWRAVRLPRTPRQPAEIDLA